MTTTEGPGDGHAGAAPGDGGAGAGASSDEFELSGAAPEKKRIHGNRTLAEYAEIYGVTDRTAKRWNAMGKKADDLPPWDMPGEMAAWWRRHSTQKPPDRLLELESTTSAKVDVGNPISGGDASAKKEPEKVTAMDLGNLELGEDEEVRQARSLVELNYRHLKEASAAGNADGVRRWQPLWKNAVDQLTKVERAWREKAQKMGKLIDRQATETEIAQMVEAMRLFRMVMPKKIRDALSGLVDGKRYRRVLRLIGSELEAAVAQVRDTEDALLRNLGQFRSAGEFTAAVEGAGC